MPIYEFICGSCDHEFEQIVSFSAATAPACPACAGNEVKRRMSKPAIHFKGSGWYITDSKTDGKKSNGNGANGGEKSKDGEVAKSASKETGDGNGSVETAKADNVKSESATKSAVTAES